MKYKTNVGQCPIFNVGIIKYINVDIFKLIQSWDIDIESTLGSRR